MGRNTIPTIKELTRQLRREGWRIVPRRSHCQAFSPDGETIITLPHSSSDRKAIHAILSLKRKVKP